MATCLNCVKHGLWIQKKLTVPCLNCSEANRKKYNLVSFNGAKFRKQYDIDELVKGKFWVSHKINGQSIEDIKKDLPKIGLPLFEYLCKNYKDYPMTIRKSNNNKLFINY